jgi:hypothetical protein
LAFISRRKEGKNCLEKRKMEHMKTLRLTKKTKIIPSLLLRNRMKLTVRSETGRKKRLKGKR